MHVHVEVEECYSRCPALVPHFRVKASSPSGGQSLSMCRSVSSTGSHAIRLFVCVNVGKGKRFGDVWTIVRPFSGSHAA